MCRSPGASASVAADPIDRSKSRSSAEKKSDKKGDGDNSGVNSSLGLINAAPVQLKTDLEQPVTSGGMETMGENPASPD